MVILLQSALNAREKALIEFNGACLSVYVLMVAMLNYDSSPFPHITVDKESLSSVIAGLPSMKKPTISTLSGDEGYAVRSVIPRKSLVRLAFHIWPSVILADCCFQVSLIPWIKANGGSDVIVSEIKQVIV